MLENPLRGSRIAHGTLYPAPSEEPITDLLSEDPLILRHENIVLAHHQEAFLAASRRHILRAGLLQGRNRKQSALLHTRIAVLLQAYAQPGEIERLPLLERPGPRGSHGTRGVHPAMVAFAEGAAEEFFRIYSDPEANLADEHSISEPSVLTAFRRANFHRIYIARVLELDALIREGRASALAEATLMRRYGPHDL